MAQFNEMAWNEEGVDVVGATKLAFIVGKRMQKLGKEIKNTVQCIVF